MALSISDGFEKLLIPYNQRYLSSGWQNLAYGLIDKVSALGDGGLGFDSRFDYRPGPDSRLRYKNKYSVPLCLRLAL